MVAVENFMEFLYIGKCRSCDYSTSVLFTQDDGRKIMTLETIPDFFFHCASCNSNQRHETISFERCASC